MRICVINPGVVHALSRTLAFAKYFDEVHFIDIKGETERSALERANVTYYGPGEFHRSHLGLIAFQRLLRTISPDAIVCHYASGTHFFNSILYNRCPVAVIAMGHDVLYDKGDVEIPWVRRLLTRMALRRTDYISAKSQFLIDRLNSYRCSGRTELNYWGSDLRQFRPGDKVKSRQRLGLPEDIPVILSPRAVEPRLNIHMIVEALEEVRKRYHDVQLVILGRTSDSYRRRIESYIAAHSLDESVRLIYEVPQQGLVDYYIAADAVVSVARSEGFPNTLLEVMSCGTPIVVGRLPQIEELLTDRETATLCDLTPSSIAESILGIFEHPDEYRRVADRARRMAMGVADIARNGAIFAASLGEVVRVPRRRKPGVLADWPYLVTYVSYLMLQRI